MQMCMCMCEDGMCVSVSTVLARVSRRLAGVG